MATLGRISGLCADYSQSTLNGRPYDKIYERMLNGQDFRFNEMMNRGGIPCELGHPTDVDSEGNPRTETDPTKVAVILTDVKPAGHQKLVAEGIIADTPNGKIFKELSQYYNFGLSSRGSYEVEDGSVEGPDGWNQDSYVFKGFDLVLLPANPGSVLSVTEGFQPHSKGIMKVAREAIDVNLLAKASEVDEDQVEKALDQLFVVDENAKPSEEISVYAMKDQMRQEEENKEPIGETEVPMETEGEIEKAPEGEIPETEETGLELEVSKIVKGKAGDPETIQIDPTQITSLSQDKDKVVFEMGKEKYQADMSLLQLMGMLSGHTIEGNESVEVTAGDEIDKIRADLETALGQINSLTEQGEKSGAEISSRNAEITKLTSDKESLQAQLDEKIQESEEFLEKFDTLKDLAEKLINSYEAAKEQFESVPKDEGPSEKEEELAERLNEAEREKKDAEDEAEREKRVSTGLRGELATAKESLISLYSMTYGLSPEALRSSLGGNYPVRRIKAVAESMANQVSRFSGMPVLTGGPRKTVKATESMNASDDVERELLEMIKNN